MKLICLWRFPSNFVSASKFETNGLAAIELRNEGDLDGLLRKFVYCWLDLVLLNELRMLNFVLLSMDTGVPNFTKLFGNDSI